MKAKIKNAKDRLQKEPALGHLDPELLSSGMVGRYSSVV